MLYHIRELLLGLPTLCILIKAYILPGFAWKVSINLHQLLPRTYCFVFSFWPMMLPFCEIYLKSYNLIIENNFFQVGVQSFNIAITIKYNKTWSFIPYTTCFWGAFLYVLQSFSFLITDIIFNSFIVGRLENIILYKFYKGL